MQIIIWIYFFKKLAFVLCLNELWLKQFNFAAPANYVGIKCTFKIDWTTKLRRFIIPFSTSEIIFYRPLVKERLREAEVFGGVRKALNVGEEVDVILMKKRDEPGLRHGNVVHQLLRVDDQLLAALGQQVGWQQVCVGHLLRKYFKC